eukprot:8139-Heterococcus_DN1.PRE.3
MLQELADCLTYASSEDLLRYTNQKPVGSRSMVTFVLSLSKAEASSKIWLQSLLLLFTQSSCTDKVRALHSSVLGGFANWHCK